MVTRRPCVTSIHFHRQVPSIVNLDYFYAKYTDWIEEFIDAFRIDKYIVLTTDREKLAEGCLKLLRSINSTVDRIVDEETKQDTSERIERHVLPSFFPLFIIGRNQRTEQLETLDLSAGDLKIIVSGKVHYTYIRRSLPTGTNNLSLPKETFNTFNLPAEK